MKKSFNISFSVVLHSMEEEELVLLDEFIYDLGRFVGSECGYEHSAIRLTEEE